MNPELARIIDGENMPSPPTVAAKLLELVDNPDTGLNDISRVISVDPKLTAKTIAYCNSPLIAPVKKVTTLQQAVTLLGIRTLKLLALSFSVMDTRSGRAFPNENFWRRSLGTAIAAKVLSSVSDQDDDESFLLGLIFNVGVMAIGIAYFDRLVQQFDPDEFLEKLTIDLEYEVCGHDRYFVGARLLERWHFPDRMIQVLETYDPNRLTEDHMVMFVAQQFSDLLLAAESTEGQILKVRETASRYLDLSKEQFDEMFDNMVQQWYGYQGLFDFKSLKHTSIQDLEAKARESMVRLSFGMEQTIREMHTEQEELRDLARTDNLTGLLNRTAFDQDIGPLMKGYHDRRESVGMIVADIDYFKKFNDQYGHAAGDKVLCGVATKLTELCRKHDHVYRFGGEEFVLMMGECDYAAAATIAERFRKGVEEMRVGYNEDLLKVTISMGICWIDSAKITDVEQIFKQADACLYEAKKNGRNCSVARKAQVSMGCVVN